MGAQSVVVLLPLLAALVSSAPTELEARQSTSEVVYLSSCNSGIPESNNFLEADYYSNIANSHNQEYPGSRSNAIQGPNYYTPPTLEGLTRSFYFPDSGVTFTSYIDSGAGSRAVGAYAGTGTNGKAFTCDRDNGSQLFSKSDGFGHTLQCQKQYYCRPN